MERKTLDDLNEHKLLEMYWEHLKRYCDTTSPEERKALLEPITEIFNRTNRKLEPFLESLDIIEIQIGKVLNKLGYDMPRVNRDSWAVSPDFGDRMERYWELQRKYGNTKMSEIPEEILKEVKSILDLIISDLLPFYNSMERSLMRRTDFLRWCVEQLF